MFLLHSEIKKHLITTALRLWPQTKGLPFELSEPDIAGHGDLATNLAMLAAKILHRPPLELAQELVSKIETETWFSEFFSKIEIKKPGFINLFFKTEELFVNLPKLLQSLTDSGNAQKKIVLEHTNVNPNKAMHIGHLRNAILGDTIRRVLDRAGFTTEVQYYVDDTGVQVADTYVGLQELKIQQTKNEKFDHYCWRVYAAITETYETSPDLLKKRTEVLHAIEKGEEPIASEVKKLAGSILQEHLKTMAQFGIPYTLLVWESDVLHEGFWEKAFAQLQKSDVFVKETEGKNKGCWVIKSDDDMVSEEYSPDKVIVKSDGTVTYTGKDIAYHLWKYNLLGADFKYAPFETDTQKQTLWSTNATGGANKEFGHADRVYNVIDVRQAYPQAMVQAALQALGYRQQALFLRHVSYGIVSLSAETAHELGVKQAADKASHSMSGRKGIGIKVDDLLAMVEKNVAAQKHTVQRAGEKIDSRAVATGAIKYYMLRYNPQTEIVFDFMDALSLEGNTGVYIQYAHARAAGILAKAGAQKIVAPKSIVLSAEEQVVIKKLFAWPELLNRVAEELNVNLITTYAFDLANSFNAFYEAQPVLKSEGMVRDQRLALVTAYKAVLADVLGILGIEAPEAM